MDKKSWLYGCRSGIQKGVRRGDPSLTRTCFESLWAVEEHRKWLVWRIPILVGEDAWPMAGELAQVQQEVKEASGLEEEKDRWQRFLMRLTIAVKNKDAWELLTPEVVNGSKHPEAVVAEAIRDRISTTCGRDQPQLIPRAEVLEVIDNAVSWGQQPSTDEYERAAIRAMDARKYQGGMLSDRWGCIAVMTLIWLRGIQEEEIQQMLEEQRKKFAGTPVRRVEELPRGAFDMHTRPGKMALRAWLKNYNPYRWSWETLDDFYFAMESAQIGRAVLPDRYKDPDLRPEPTWRDEVWWPRSRRLAIERAASEGGVSPRELINRWQQEHVPEMEKLIAWALKKNS